jgi:lysophospholipase L1-like esterase
VTVITETINLPGSSIPRSALVHVYLCGAAGDAIEGFVAGTSIVSRHELRVSTGDWQLDLAGNTLITPAGTAWRRVITIAGATVADDYLSVPTAGGPYRVDQVLTTAPASIVPPGAAASSLPFLVRSPQITLPNALATRAGDLGLYVPSGWGSGWRAARAQAGSRRVTGVGVGDSIPWGAFSSDFRTKGWMGKLWTDLQALLGDGGSGFLSVANSNTYPSVQGATYMTCAGTGGVNGWNQTGNGINEISISPATEVTGSLTINGVRGSNMDVYQFVSVLNQNMTYNIDGAGAIPVPWGFIAGSGTTDLRVNGAAWVATYPNNGIALTPGPHTVAFVPTQQVPIIGGVNAYNPTGFIGHNMSYPGRNSNFGQSTTWFTGGITSGQATIKRFSPDLLVIALGVNDIAAATSTDTYVSRISYLIKLAREYNSACDVILVAEHQGASADLSDQVASIYPRYVNALANLAQTFNCAFYNVWGGVGRNDYTYWNSLGYWGITNGSSGGSGTDTIHLSDIGHGVVEAPLLELLAS